MPQLSPINWTLLFLFSFSMVLSFSVIIWWHYLPSFSVAKPLSHPNLISWKWN